MYGLEFTLVLILLAICFLFAYPFSGNTGITKIPSKIKPTDNNHLPVVMVIGATSTRGQKVLKLLQDKPLVTIAISRRETRWLRIKSNFPKVVWYKGDLRLSNEMDYLFEQIKQNYGRIDYVINLTYISGSIDAVSKISSIKVKDNVFFKLPQAYDPELLAYDHAAGSAGEESPLFTNLFGCVVLKNLCQKYHVQFAGMILGSDSVVNELINSYVNQIGGVTKFIAIEPTELTNKINELINL